MVDRKHPTPDKPETANLGDLLSQQLSREEMNGLVQIISSARRPARDDAPRGGERSNPDYDSIIARVMPRVTGERQRFVRERHEVPELFAELMQHPIERRRVLVANSARFHSWSFCDLLLKKSLDACFEDTAEAIELAELAVEVSGRLSGEQHSEAMLNDQRARALCYLANARRVAGQPKLSEEAFSQAEELLLEGTGDLMELARLRSLQGALRGDQRRFDECFELFDRALAIYRRCGDDHFVGRTQIKKARFFSYAGEADKAIATLQEGLAQIDSEREPRLAMAANHNLILDLNEAGRGEEAERLLESTRGLYERHGGRLDLLRLRWLEANLARERGDLDEAEEAFRKTREALLQEGIGCDVALVSLELAAIYAQQGRFGEIKALAEELVPVFRANDLRREAIAALILFQKAVQMEKITLGLIRSTMGQIRSLRQDR